MDDKDLEIFIGKNTKTIKILDRFDGLNGGEPYKRLIINNAFIKKNYDEETIWIHLIVERSRTDNYVGDITFTEFKNGDTLEFREYVMGQVDKGDVKESGTIMFEKPYLLRAQNSTNRIGYGWRWDWSDPYSPDITEGTPYGETTNYYFVGCILGEYKMNPTKILELELKYMRKHRR